MAYKTKSCLKCYHLQPNKDGKSSSCVKSLRAKYGITNCKQYLNRREYMAGLIKEKMRRENAMDPQIKTFQDKIKEAEMAVKK